MLLAHSLNFILTLWPGKHFISSLKVIKNDIGIKCPPPTHTHIFISVLTMAYIVSLTWVATEILQETHPATFLTTLVSWVMAVSYWSPQLLSLLSREEVPSSMSLFFQVSFFFFLTMCVFKCFEAEHILSIQKM